MAKSIVDYLSLLDIGLLERLAGETIVRAVRSAFDTNRESELARLVSDRFGTSILENADVRTEILSSIPGGMAKSSCGLLNIAVGPQEVPHAKLIEYFNRAYNVPKSIELTNILDLGPEYVKTVVVDDRQETELLTAQGKPAVAKRGYLHPFQFGIKDQVVRLVSGITRRGMVQMPTGSGKTATALELVVDLFRTPSERRFVVWLVDSTELAEQAYETFKSLWLQKGDRPLHAHRVFGRFCPNFQTAKEGFVVATFDKLRAPLNDVVHSKNSSIWTLIQHTDLLIVDEAHTSTAETYEVIIRKFLTGGDPILLGLSATPARNGIDSTAELARLYGGTLISLRDEDGLPIDDPIKYLQQEGFLARLELSEFESGVVCKDNDDPGICRSLAQDSVRNGLIIKQIELALKLEEPTLVFSCTKDHVFALMALCRANGIHSEFIVGETPTVARKRILDDFRSGKLCVLINHEILATGVDLPNVRRLIITRPVGSPILFSQILGRALRGPKNGGRELNTVVSFRDNIKIHGNASLVFQKFASDFCYSV